MRVQWWPVELRTREPFVTSHGGGSTFRNVVVTVEHDGVVGYGEAAPTHYHGETQETVLAALPRLAAAVEAVGDPGAIESVHAAMERALAGHASARAAIDIACHDWLGRRLDVPVWRLLAGDLTGLPPSSYTVAVGDAATVRRTLAAGRGFRAWKVKMGDAGDVERLEAVRAATEQPVRVDANGGWTVDQALRRLPLLEEAGVELLEQPLPERDRRGMRELRGRARLPLVIDEPARQPRDVIDWAPLVDGINIKLAKSGGIRPALRMVHAARACGLRVMLGCMVETSIGIAAGAALAPLMDWVDLDGAWLLDDDPAVGPTLIDGKVTPADAPGLGVRWRNPAKAHGG